MDGKYRQTEGTSHCAKSCLGLRQDVENEKEWRTSVNWKIYAGD